MALLLLALAAACWLAWPCAAIPSGNRFAEARVARRAAAALWHMAGAPCPEQGGFLPLPPGPAVYVSTPPGRKVRALLPDGWGDRPGCNRSASLPAHDAVLVLDPSPTASFGHFYVNFHMSWCRSRDRLYLGVDGLAEDGL